MIDEGLFFGALMVVAFFLMVLSVPTIILTARSASKMFKRFRTLRDITLTDYEYVPKQLVDEWNAVNSPLAYTTLLADEIDKLDALRPAFLHSTISFIIMLVLAFYPGYTFPILCCMMLFMIFTVAAVIYGWYKTKLYVAEYVDALEDVDNNGDEAVSRIYG